MWEKNVPIPNHPKNELDRLNRESKRKKESE
jgi:hypothetical protein